MYPQVYLFIRKSWNLWTTYLGKALSQKDFFDAKLEF
jgi:hypothetical protein